jgi:hypothetical protein
VQAPSAGRDHRAGEREQLGASVPGIAHLRRLHTAVASASISGISPQSAQQVNAAMTMEASIIYSPIRQDSYESRSAIPAMMMAKAAARRVMRSSNFPQTVRVPSDAR